VRLLLIRHGQTPSNVLGLLDTAPPGPGLTDLGVEQAAAPAHLRGGGWLLVEHGSTQAAAVRELFAHAGFAQVETRRDLAGLERATGGRRP
jgi:release factor glutamine methyltransferase